MALSWLCGSCDFVVLCLAVVVRAVASIQFTAQLARIMSDGVSLEGRAYNNALADCHISEAALQTIVLFFDCHLYICLFTVANIQQI